MEPKVNFRSLSPSTLQLTPRSTVFLTPVWLEPALMGGKRCCHLVRVSCLPVFCVSVPSKLSPLLS